MQRWLLRVALLTLVWLRPPASAAEPTGEEIVREMVKTYNAMTSYEETGTERVRQKVGEQERSSALTHRFAYRAPNKFYYESREGEEKTVVVSDGKSLYYYMSARKVCFRVNAPARLAGSSRVFQRLGAMTTMDPFSFLRGEDPLRGVKVDEVKAVTLDEQPTYRVRFSGEGTTRVIWIGRDDHLIYRLELTLTRTVQGQEARIEVTETHADMKPNAPVDDKIFAFTPPEGTRVAELTIPEDFVGKPAPEFIMKDIDGKSVELASLKGKTVVLTFWVHWFPPAVQQLAALQRIARDLKDKGVVVLSVTREYPQRPDPDWEKTRQVIKELGITFPVLLDEKADLDRAYRIEVLPRTFIIDPKGVVRSDTEGVESEEFLREKLGEVM